MLMPYLRTRSGGALAAAFAFATFVAACQDNAGPGTPALSQSQADSLAEQIVLDADAENDVATTSGVGAFDLVGGSSSAMALNGSACVPTVSPLPIVNTDGDRAPDSIRITFANCANSWPLHTDSISGSIDVIDPTPAAAGANVRFAFTDLRHKRVFTLSNLFTSVTLNGVRQAARTNTTLQHTVTDFTTDYVFRNGGTASHNRDWSSNFTADVAGSITFDSPLPSGTWTIAGTSSWARGSRTHQVTIATSPPLHFNASCTVVPRFDAGTLTAVVTRNGNQSTVTVAFTACGTYTVTRS
jgi:hypothetical protein